MGLLRVNSIPGHHCLEDRIVSRGHRHWAVVSSQISSTRGLPCLSTNGIHSRTSNSRSSFCWTNNPSFFIWRLYVHYTDVYNSKLHVSVGIIASINHTYTNIISFPVKFLCGYQVAAIQRYDVDIFKSPLICGEEAIWTDSARGAPIS